VERVRIWKILGLALLAAGLGAGAGVALDRLLPESPLVRGLFIGHRRVPQGQRADAWLASQNAAIRAGTIVLRAQPQEGDDRWIERSFTFGDLGIDLDVPAILNDAEAVGHRGKLFARLREAREARRGDVDIDLKYTADEATAESVLESFAPAIARDPIDARMDLHDRRKIPDQPGRALDVRATLDAILASDFHDGEVIDLVTRPVQAKVTVDALAGVDIEKVVSSYETAFHTFGTGAGRAVNIANAAHFIDGTVIMPGEIFSFNEHVGPRTLERGFTWAPEIQADELTTGVGGGTCQASTTLFGAALFATLDVVERRSHSRPSSYTKLGLDATVIYPSQDLKIKNTLSFPIMIHAFLPTSETVRVELLGGDPVADVSYTFGIGSSSDFLRRITVKPFLPPGTQILHQRGGRGYDVTSVVSIKWRDGRTEERSYFSGYRPTPEVFWVGPGYDENDLPPLPEHARGIEGRALAATDAPSPL